MYSVVLMMALTSGGDVPAWGHGCSGCYGCCGCCGGCYGGCHGGRMHGCHGCHGCGGGCHGGHHRHGCFGCSGGCYGCMGCSGGCFGCMGCSGGCFGVSGFGCVGGVSAPILLGTPVSYRIPTTQSITPAAAVVAAAAAVRTKTYSVANSSKSLEMDGGAEVGVDTADLAAEVFGILAQSSGKVQSKDAIGRRAKGDMVLGLDVLAGLRCTRPTNSSART